MAYRAIKMTPSDNVAVAVSDIPAGAAVEIPEGGEMVVNQAIPLGHKIALTPIKSGGDIVRYGEVICTAVTDIAPGDHVHMHNTRAEH